MRFLEGEISARIQQRPKNRIRAIERRGGLVKSVELTPALPPYIATLYRRIENMELQCLLVYDMKN